MEDIDTILSDILSQDRPDIEFYKKKYPHFFTKFPILSRAVFEENVDRTILEYMVHQKKMLNERNTDDAYHEASVNVGTLLRDKYVSPVVNNIKQP